MTRIRWLLILAGLMGGLLISGHLVLRAQDDPAGVRKDGPSVREAMDPAVRGAGGAISLQDALLRPYRFAFARPTPLVQVCAHLKQTLKASVVLDLAALDRQDVEPEDSVQLELEGVRLKTGLKLLLDQVGLTYRVISEDNLMIITDREGSDDPTDRIFSELQALHRDLHSVQDELDELRGLMGDDRQGGRVRRPTIIEEVPEAEGQRPVVPDTKPATPRQRPGVDQPGAGAARPAPARVPLHGPRRVIKRKRTVAPFLRT